MENIDISSVCRGCLSIDRKLRVLSRNDFARILPEAFDDFENLSDNVSLCWECNAIVRKTLQFQNQVKCAQECLERYLYYRTQLTPLTKINKSETVTDAFNSYELPQTFVKIENLPDTDFDADVDSGYFLEVDMDKTYVHEDSDEKDLKIIQEVDIPKTEIRLTKERKCKKKKVVEEFDESDDEPLNLKKDKEDTKEQKVKGRRRKKDVDGEEGPNVARRRRSAKRREKAPGVVHNPRVSRTLQHLNVNSEQVQMILLSWEEVEAERQKALQSDTFTRHKYRCDWCITGFNHKFKLQNHMIKHEPSSGNFECDVCKTRSKDAHSLSAHRRRHRVRWRCVSCGDTASRAAVTADHFARAHGAPPPTHTCAVCGHCETTLGKLRNHLKNHGERQKCELCGKTFRDRASLKTHLFIHKGEKEYACPECGKRFLFKKAMQLHVLTHQPHAHLYCHQCDMSFKNQMSYYQHMKYNLKHIDPAMLKYECDLCEKKFAKAIRLEEHKLAIHLKATPVACTVPGCEFACASRPVLRRHIRAAHRAARAPRNHVCDTCGKAYTAKKILEGHMRTHTGERPYRCTHCPATFAYQAALYNHNKLVHLKQKTPRFKDTGHAGAAEVDHSANSL